MISRNLVTVIGSVFLLGMSAMADTLVLKDGSTIKGTYTGGTASSVTFEAHGSARSYSTEDIVSLTFTSTTAVLPATGSAATTQPPKAKEPVSINAGTRLMVRTQSTVQTGQSSSGDRFTASLESDLVVGGVVVAPRGSTVYGRVAESVRAGRLAGRAKLVLEVTDLMVNNQLYPVVSDQLGYEGGRSGTLKKIALGAAAGGIIDGSSGAGKGAGIGAGVAVLTKGQQIHIPAGSILEFRTQQPITIQNR